VTEILIALLIGLVGHTLATEFDSWAPRIADVLLRFAVRLLPDSLRCRMISEWRAHLVDTPLPHRKLFASIAFVIGGVRIRLAHTHRSREADDDQPLPEPLPGISLEAPSPVRPRVKLSDRQRECLIYAARGKSDSVIAQLLDIKPKTVNQHIEAAKRKYKVASRAQLIVEALYDSQIDFAEVVADPPQLTCHGTAHANED
jgi:DNA-binding CsgD family transcriptional regulator